METLHQLAATHPYWSLEEFAMIANQWLPRVLPESKANSRVREDVNPRLIRQYTTWGLVDAPGKEGREARYGYRHLLQLLVTRRLLADGYATAVIHRLMAGQDDAALEAMLGGGAQLTVATEPPANPAMAFLQGLTQRTFPTSKPTPSMPAPAAKAKKAAALREEAPEPELMKEAARRSRSASEGPMSLPPELEPAMEAEEESLASYESAASPMADALAFDDAPLAAPLPPPMAASARAMAPSPAPAPLLAPAPAPTSPERWLRWAIAPGLELAVRDDAALPATPAEREALAAMILERLTDMSTGR